MLAESNTRTLIDELLAEQQRLTAVELFSLRHQANDFQVAKRFYRDLLPGRSLEPGEQFAFEVDLDACSGCKACVTACHNRNGLEEGESWRKVGLLHNGNNAEPFLQTITTACHHCVDPACLNGCPVLAYDKDPVTGIVRHLDDQCIGCHYCVMKCPYEVPKYSERLGIVRKCDMCANRLANGEAPACAQACPNGAIQITAVRQEEIRVRYERTQLDAPAASAATLNSFLPDSPDPSTTLPSTRFFSRRGLPLDARAADHDLLRLDSPHRPLVFMLVLTQAAAGALVGAALNSAVVRPLTWAAFVMSCAGLAGSILHLGQPLKAWRAFLGWRTSWLSREIIAFNLFALCGAVAAGAAWVPRLSSHSSLLAGAAAVCGLVAVCTSAMVYVDTGRPLWSPGLVFSDFFGTTFLLGATLTAVVFAWVAEPPLALRWALSAGLVLGTALFLGRRLVWTRALRDPGSPIHFNARVVHRLLPWTVSGQIHLFIAAIVPSVLALVALGQTPALLAGLAALATFASEMVARFVFFSAGASRRMPGGIGT